MGTARAKKLVWVDDPAAGEANILGGRGVFSPSQATPSSCATTWAGPVLHCLANPTGPSGVFPLDVTAGAGKRGGVACSEVDGGRGG